MPGSTCGAIGASVKLASGGADAACGGGAGAIDATMAGGASGIGDGDIGAGGAMSFALTSSTDFGAVGIAAAAMSGGFAGAGVFVSAAFVGWGAVSARAPVGSGVASLRGAGSTRDDSLSGKGDGATPVDATNSTAIASGEPVGCGAPKLSPAAATIAAWTARDTTAAMTQPPRAGEIESSRSRRGRACGRMIPATGANLAPVHSPPSIAAARATPPSAPWPRAL
jgi:hypothetical protein